MIQLTEKIVTRVALTFLKRHYRFMPRSSDTQISSNVSAGDNIVADGFLAFRRDEHKTDQVFTATVEATDYMNREELRYSIYWQLLLIDSLTGALVLVALGAGWGHIRGEPSVYPIGPWASAFFLLGATIILAGILAFFLRPLRRYLYIYAIEQFKQYHADEQWIAFAWDVFHSTESKFYKELRRQCIAYGFGLMEVGRDKHVKLHLAPTKIDVFSNQRAVRRFRLQQDLGKAVRKRMETMPKVSRPLLKAPLKKASKDLFRFRRSYKHQILICGVSILLTAVFFGRELQEKPIRYADSPAARKQREKQAAEMKQTRGGETTIFVVDTAFLPPPMPDVQSYLDMTDRRRQEKILVKPKAATAALFLYDDGTFREIPCQRMASEQEDRYVVYMNSYNNLTLAKTAVLQLRSFNIPVNIAWADCFFPGLTFYILYNEDLYTNFEDAQRQRRRLQDELEKTGMDVAVNIGRLRPR